MPLISIVVPCYNEQESLPIFLKELDGVVHAHVAGRHEGDAERAVFEPGVGGGGGRGAALLDADALRERAEA